MTRQRQGPVRPAARLAGTAPVGRMAGFLLLGWLALLASGSPSRGQDRPAHDDFRFAPTGARHDDRTRYQLPYEPEIPRLLSQGVDGTTTHQGIQRYAFDFLLPTGTPVLAAREGTVARVQDGSTRGGPDPSFGDDANEVMVLHDDGTFGMYLHLEPGIPVRRGQRVATGETLGRSGCTGYCMAPHLHFAVAVRADPLFRTVPIRFGEAGTPGMVPQEGEYYGARRPPTVRLEIDVDGRTLAEGETVRLPRRGSVAFRAFLRTRQGSRRDVTELPALRFASLTPWSLDVGADGRVVARPMPGYEDYESQISGAEIIVVFGRLTTPGFAQRQVTFEVIEAPAAP